MAATGGDELAGCLVQIPRRTRSSSTSQTSRGVARPGGASGKSDLPYFQGTTAGVRLGPGRRRFGCVGRRGAGPRRRAGAERCLSVQGLPIIKPPYGRITAINLDKGTAAGRSPHGDTPDNVRNHPALKGLNLPRTGQPGNIGTLVTKTLVIAGESRVTTPPGVRGAMLRAYDKNDRRRTSARSTCRRRRAARR